MERSGAQSLGDCAAAGGQGQTQDDALDAGESGLTGPDSLEKLGAKPDVRRSASEDGQMKRREAEIGWAGEDCSGQLAI